MKKNILHILDKNEDYFIEMVLALKIHHGIINMYYFSKV